MESHSVVEPTRVRALLKARPAPLKVDSLVASWETAPYTMLKTRARLGKLDRIIGSAQKIMMLNESPPSTLTGEEGTHLVRQVSRGEHRGVDPPKVDVLLLRRDPGALLVVGVDLAQLVSGLLFAFKDVVALIGHHLQLKHLPLLGSGGARPEAPVHHHGLAEDTPGLR